MKLLLVKGVQGVGERGAVVDVSDGYAMNFLIPKGFAVIATSSVIKANSSHQDRVSRARAAQIEKMKEDSMALRNIQVHIMAPAAPTGRLFGAVVPRMIVQALKERGFEVPEKSVILPTKVDHIGVHIVTIRFSKDIETSIQLTVAIDHHGKH